MAGEGAGAGWQGDLERWLGPFLARLGLKARQRMCPLNVAGLIVGLPRFCGHRYAADAADWNVAAIRSGVR